MTTLGWKTRTWKRKTGCRACRRPILAGVTNPNDDGDPPVSPLCFRDFNLLVESPEEFARRYEDREPS